MPPGPSMRALQRLTQDELAEHMGTTQTVVARAVYSPLPGPWNAWRKRPVRALSFASSIETGTKAPEFDEKLEAAEDVMDQLTSSAPAVPA